MSVACQTLDSSVDVRQTIRQLVDVRQAICLTACEKNVIHSSYGRAAALPRTLQRVGAWEREGGLPVQSLLRHCNHLALKDARLCPLPPATEPQGIDNELIQGSIQGSIAEHVRLNPHS